MSLEKVKCEYFIDPIESAEFISKNAEHVKINESGVNLLSQKIYDAFVSDELSIDRFSQSELHPSKDEKNGPDWIFLIDSLNFSFWSSEPGSHWEVSYRGKKYTGYFALCAAIRKAIHNGINLSDPHVLSSLTKDDFLKIFESDSNISIPLPDEREEVRIEIGAQLAKFNYSFTNLIKESNQSAIKLLQLILQHFPSYRDEAVYKNKRVGIYKRAQILVGDIWACYGGEGIGEFHDMDKLTMFADYRVPQVLLHFNVMSYSEHLNKLLTKNVELSNGSEEEVEIRGVSIAVVELLKSRINQLLIDNNVEKRINSVLIDHFLWDFRREHAEEMEKCPFHKTRFIYY